MFREVSGVQIKEALRRWLKGEGERPIAHGVGVDRKTARRYIAAALELGIDRSGGEGQLTDELIGQRWPRRCARTAQTATVRPWRSLLAEAHEVASPEEEATLSERVHTGVHDRIRDVEGRMNERQGRGGCPLSL